MIDKIGIASIFRNEYPFVVEWVAYHRSLGVKRFFIADNESNDGTRELLICLRDLGYIDLEFQPALEGGNSQLAAYAKILKKNSDNVEWMAFIDADEFLVVDGPERSLDKYLSRVEKSEGVGAIAINWAVYGSSHQITASRGFVTDRFSLRAEQEQSINRHYKTLVRTSSCRGAGSNPHFFKLKRNFGYIDSSGRWLERDELGGLMREPVWDGLRLNHYVVKSRSEFFRKKRPRGRPGGMLRTAEFFQQHDFNDKEDRLDDVASAALLLEYQSIVERLRGIGFDYQEKDYDLDALYSRRNSKVKFRVDRTSLENEKIECSGWIAIENCIDFKLLIDYEEILSVISVERVVRLDVARHLKADPAGLYGFKCIFDISGIFNDSRSVEKIELCIGDHENGIVALINLDIKKPTGMF